MYKAYMEAKEMIPDGEQYGAWGLIFPWNGLGNVILHNCQIAVNGTRFSKEINKNSVYLDILLPFLEATTSIWSV